MPYTPPPSSGGGSGDALTTNPLSQFAATTSAQLAGVITNETGSGALVFGTSPAIATPTGIVKGDVGLGSVDNTSDAGKPVSTAQQTALDLKANLASPTFTGTVTLPSGQALVAPALGTPASGTLTNCTFPTLNQNTTGSAAKWTTARTLATTGDVTYTSGSFDGSGNATGTATVANVNDSATFTHDLTAIPNATGGWTEYFVTGSNFTTTNLTATPITGLVTGTLSTSTLYEIQASVLLLNAADATGMKMAWTTTSGGSGTVIGTGTTSATACTSETLAIDTLGAARVGVSGLSGIYTFTGFILTNSSGSPTISLECAKVTSNTATVKVGSVLRVRKAHT